MVARTVEEYYLRGNEAWLRLIEKVGKQQELPANHTLEDGHGRRHVG
jgi:hypothetical protein